jgi:ComF family protein
VWEFNDAVQAIIHELKYQGKKALAQPLGEEMAKAAAQDAEYAAAGTILPVPLHKTKFRERGYNQSLLLSAVVSEILNIPVETEVLKRVRYTKSQSRLNSAERDKNMQGAFQVVKPDLIQNNVTIVVDDVLTTGSTLRACARVLMEAGAAKVLALTAAKTP